MCVQEKGKAPERLPKPSFALAGIVSECSGCAVCLWPSDAVALTQSGPRTKRDATSRGVHATNQTEKQVSWWD